MAHRRTGAATGANAENRRDYELRRDRPRGKTQAFNAAGTLDKLGWAEGKNVEIQIRWAAGRSDLMLAYGSQFVSEPADVIIGNSTPLLTVLKQLTNTVPIVFVQVADPIGSAFVSNYARPGGNITGFTDLDPSVAAKWVEILKELAPLVNRVTVLLNPDQANHRAFQHAIETAAPSIKVKAVAAEVHNRAEIEQALNRLSGETGNGLVVLPGPLNNTQRDLIIDTAARLRLPAVYPFKYYVNEGGLVYYGADQVDKWSKAAGYVDRILHGEKPGDLPVQAPTKYDLVINRKTAKLLGLTIPQELLATADEVIE